MSKPEKEISRAFASPINWYIAGIMIRFEGDGENQINSNRRCLAWENQHLIKAENPDEAYVKALKIGKKSASKYVNTEGENVKRIFEGLTMLIPVYEELEDGAEIMWTKRENKAVKKIKKQIRSKENLEVFQKD